MKGLVLAISVIIAALLLFGCAAPQTPPAKLFQQDREALDKAKGVEQTVGKSADDLKREEEKQTK